MDDPLKSVIMIFWCSSKLRGKHQPNVSDLFPKCHKALPQSELTFLLNTEKKKINQIRGGRTNFLRLYFIESDSLLAQFLKLVEINCDFLYTQPIPRLICENDSY